jgi:hypothetical protein
MWEEQLVEVARKGAPCSPSRDTVLYPVQARIENEAGEGTMTGSFAIFVMLGAIATIVFFMIIEAIKRTREHELAAALSAIVGLVILISPLRPLMLSTAGALADGLASWIWSVIYGIAWTIGTMLSYFALRKFRS